MSTGSLFPGLKLFRMLNWGTAITTKKSYILNVWFETTWQLQIEDSCVIIIFRIWCFFNELVWVICCSIIPYLQFNINLEAVAYVHSGIEVRLNSSYNRPRRAREGSRNKALFFFNLGARWGGWSTPHPGRCIPGKRQEAGWDPGPFWTAEKNLAPHWDSISGSSSL